MQDRKALSARELGQELGIGDRTLFSQHDEAVRPIGREGRERALDVFGRAELEGFGVEPQAFRGAPRRRVTPVEEDSTRRVVDCSGS